MRVIFWVLSLTALSIVLPPPSAFVFPFHFFLLWDSIYYLHLMLC
jgi:hypothetical protein